MKLFKVFLLVLFLFVGAWTFFVKAYLPTKIKGELSTQFSKLCQTCTLKMDEVEVSFLLNPIKLEDIVLHAGNPKNTSVEFKVEELIFDIKIRRLFEKRLVVRSISAEEPVISITEGDGITPDTSNPLLSQDWVYDIRKTLIDDGYFVYTKVKSHHKAPITVKDIQAIITRVTNRKDSRDLQSHANIIAQLEESGAVDLKISTALFLGFQNISIDLSLANQNLSEMNAYFQPNDGIILNGILNKGHSVVSVLNNRLKASVQADYKDLDVIFQSTKDRSPTENFFSNLVSAIQLKEKNNRSTSSEQIKAISLTQNTNESLVSFIFRGMRDAALDVAKGNTQANQLR